jgi:hypothetical protein
MMKLILNRSINVPTFSLFHPHLNKSIRFFPYEPPTKSGESKREGDTKNGRRGKCGWERNEVPNNKKMGQAKEREENPSGVKRKSIWEMDKEKRQQKKQKLRMTYLCQKSGHRGNG